MLPHRPPAWLPETVPTSSPNDPVTIGACHGDASCRKPFHSTVAAALPSGANEQGDSPCDSVRLDPTDGSISKSPGVKGRGSNSRCSRRGHNCAQRRRKSQTEVLDFGQVCHVNGWTKNWLFVKRIVADWTLIELVGPSPGEAANVDYPSCIVAECPLGTETTQPVAEMKARLNAYAKESDSEFTKSLPKSANTRKSEEANAHADIGGQRWGNRPAACG
jgi:hypothetical protein